MTLAALHEYEVVPGDKIVSYWKGTSIYVERRKGNNKGEIIGHFTESARANEFAKTYAEKCVASMCAHPHGVKQK